MKNSVIILALLALTGCSAKDMNTFNRAVHDTSVEMDRQRAKDKCIDDYNKGYYTDMNCENQKPHERRLPPPKMYISPGFN